MGCTRFSLDGWTDLPAALLEDLSSGCLSGPCKAKSQAKLAAARQMLHKMAPHCQPPFWRPSATGYEKVG